MKFIATPFGVYYYFCVRGQNNVYKKNYNYNKSTNCVLCVEQNDFFKAFFYAAYTWVWNKDGLPRLISLIKDESDIVFTDSKITSCKIDTLDIIDQDGKWIMIYTPVTKQNGKDFYLKFKGQIVEDTKQVQL